MNLMNIHPPWCICAVPKCIHAELCTQNTHNMHIRTPTAHTCTNTYSCIRTSQGSSQDSSAPTLRAQAGAKST